LVSFLSVLVMYLAALGMVALPMAATLAHQVTMTGESTGEAHDLSAGSPGETRRERALVREVVKQSIEQPLHFLMAAGPIWLSRCLTAVPWYGWSMVPALAYREWRQWPSNRWWDPLLDATFLILGVIGATWRAGPVPRRLRARWLPRPGRAQAAEVAPASVIRGPVSAER
jgi:hypothetical protein